MGNSSTKESRSATPSASRSSGLRQSQSSSPSSQRHATTVPVTDGLPIVYSHRPSRSGRSDLTFLSLGGSADRDAAAVETRKETRQEREARKLEKERVLRLRERERSVREEGVDGGYLVTLGTYTGIEDFNKSIVRQLMIERRLAPFWKGLNDHSDSWTEHQLVAAARGLPIPAADEIPPEEPPQLSTNYQVLPEASDPKLASPSVSILSSSAQPNTPSNLSSSNPTPSQASTSFPTTSQSTLSPLFRGRAKTLASLSSSSKSHTDFTPPEIQLPREPQVNGQPVEAYLYKDASECPICFLYYPPYLNKTRCCDQSICSECFVQIKRPDPHPPEHADPSLPPPVAIDPRSTEPDGQLVSEPAACPFCVQPEFGVTYDPPPFRRGLTYAQHPSSPLARTSSAMSSETSISSSNGAPSSNLTVRRRTHSLSATATTVITTDKVRPDWAKKLSDARSQAARRSAAATALHTAAYMMGGQSGQPSTWLERRRRSSQIMENATYRLPEGMTIGGMGALLAALEGQGPSRSAGANPDLFPGRESSRRARVDDLEDMMMMEAIRLSLAAEEDRKKKEDKEAAKQAKKDEKKSVKEQKKAEKAAKKSGLYTTDSNDSASFLESSPQSSFVEESRVEEGKGKAKAFPQDAVAYVGFNPLNEPTSTLNASSSSPQDISSTKPAAQPADAQPTVFGASPTQRSHLRHMSNASSLDSLLDSGPSTPPPDAAASSPSAFAPSESFVAAAPANVNPGADQSFNFGSLAAMIDRGDGAEKTTARDDGAAGTVEGAPATTVRRDEHHSDEVKDYESMDMQQLGRQPTQ